MSCRVIALYDFVPAEEDELSIAAGDVLTVMHELDNGWIFCARGEQQGYVPTAYTQVLAEDHPENVITADENAPESTDPQYEHQVCETDHQDQQQEHQQQPQSNDDQLEQWTEQEDQMDLFPVVENSTNVEEVEVSSDQLNDSENESSNQPTDYYSAEDDVEHNPQRDTEISLTSEDEQPEVTEANVENNTEIAMPQTINEPETVTAVDSSLCNTKEVPETVDDGGDNDIHQKESSIIEPQADTPQSEQQIPERKEEPQPSTVSARRAAFEAARKLAEQAAMGAASKPAPYNRQSLGRRPLRPFFAPSVEETGGDATVESSGRVETSNDSGTTNTATSEEFNAKKKFLQNIFAGGRPPVQSQAVQLKRMSVPATTTESDTINNEEIHASNRDPVTFDNTEYRQRIKSIRQSSNFSHIAESLNLTLQKRKSLVAPIGGIPLGQQESEPESEPEHGNEHQPSSQSEGDSTSSSKRNSSEVDTHDSEEIMEASFTVHSPAESDGIKLNTATDITSSPGATETIPESTTSTTDDLSPTSTTATVPEFNGQQQSNISMVNHTVVTVEAVSASNASSHPTRLPDLIARPPPPRKAPPLPPKTRRGKESRLSESQAASKIQAAYRRYACIKNFRNFLRKSPEIASQRNRMNIIREIVETEEAYVESLRILIDVFVTPCRQRGKMLDDNDFKKVFSNIEAIYQFNSIFAKELKPSLDFAENSAVRKIGIADPFNKCAPFFKLYTVYINNYDNFTVDSVKENNKPFARFLESCYQDKRCGGVRDITFFLIKPVQRIPRYRLLLQDLLKKTPQDHVEYKPIMTALESIIDIASFVNESKRQLENIKVVRTLKHRIQYRYENLVLAHRMFLKEGNFKVTCIPRNIVNVPYKCYVFTDVLILETLASAERHDSMLESPVVTTTIQRRNSQHRSTPPQIPALSRSPVDTQHPSFLHPVGSSPSMSTLTASGTNLTVNAVIAASTSINTNGSPTRPQSMPLLESGVPAGIETLDKTFILIFYSFVTIHPNESDELTFELEAFQRGRRIIYALTADTAAGKTKILDEITNNVEQVRKANEQRGIDSDEVPDLEMQRTALAANLPSTHQTLEATKLEAQKSAAELQTIEKSLSEHEEQLKKLLLIIEREKAEKDFMQSQVDTLTNEVLELQDKLGEQATQKVDCDAKFMMMLNDDVSAFRELFGDTPSASSNRRWTTS